MYVGRRRSCRCWPRAKSCSEKKQRQKQSFVSNVTCAKTSASPSHRLTSLLHSTSTVFSAGPQPRPSTPSVPCRTSTTTIHAQCSLPDLNHDHPRPVFAGPDHPRPVFPAGPQPRVSTPSVPCRTSCRKIWDKEQKKVRKNVRKNVRRYARRYARRTVRKEGRGSIVIFPRSMHVCGSSKFQPWCLMQQFQDSFFFCQAVLSFARLSCPCFVLDLQYSNFAYL